MYIKHCKVLIEPSAESKDKNEGIKTDKGVVMWKGKKREILTLNDGEEVDRESKQTEDKMVLPKLSY